MYTTLTYMTLIVVVVIGYLTSLDVKKNGSLATVETFALPVIPGTN